MGRRNGRKGGKRGRKRGTRVTYSTYQTRRYQSIWLRTQRAIRLQPPTRLGDGVWQFRSKRKRVRPYRTTTAEGSLLPIEAFTGTVTTSGTPAPATAFDYLAPLFRWSASGIEHRRSPPSNEPTSEPQTLPPTLDVPYCFVPGSQTVLVYLDVTERQTTRVGAFFSQRSPPLPGDPGLNAINTMTSKPDATFGSYLLTSSQCLTYVTVPINEIVGTTLCGSLITQTGTRTDVYLNDAFVITKSYSFYHNQPSCTFDNNTTYQFYTETYTSTVRVRPEGGVIFPAPGGAAGGGGGGGGGGDPDLATAGGEWESNVFQVDERFDILTTIAYSIVSGMPPPSGSISLKLFADGLEEAELSEAPTEPGAGSLNRPMTLLPDIDYQFKISIPESIYCDAAIVRLGGKFICNCPDWNRRSPAFPSRYSSELGDRDWTTSGAGTRSDCKHIIYLKLQTGEPIDAEPDDLKDIRQWRKDNEARQKVQRKQERQEEAQGRRDALKRVKQDERAIRQRERAIIDAARSEVKAARNYMNRKPRQKSTKPRKYRGDVYTGGG